MLMPLARQKCRNSEKNGVKQVDRSGRHDDLSYWDLLQVGLANLESQQDKFLMIPKGTVYN
eukprot:scaffold353130_cov17-Prasinocladus_malaysianus.AAC.1